jgi:hypothetical protein
MRSAVSPFPRRCYPSLPLWLSYHPIDLRYHPLPAFALAPGSAYYPRLQQLLRSPAAPEQEAGLRRARGTGE